MMRMKLNRTGEIITTKEGKIKIIGYDGALNCTIKFLETGSIVKNLQYSNVKNGLIKDPMRPSVYNKGYLGIGPYSKKENHKEYSIWFNMLRRCYDTKIHAKYPTYNGCIVVKRWHNFQNFCADIVKMKNWNTSGFELDKDLRVFGNKKYGPRYCSFVPKSINRSSIVLVEKDLPIGVQAVGDRYRANVNFENKRRHLGYFTSPDRARAVYVQYKLKNNKLLARKYRTDLHSDVYRNLMDSKCIL